jgi:hypothetical protein
VERIGTIVTDRMYEPIIAKPTERAIGTNMARVAPVMKNDGVNTARMQSIANRPGMRASFVAS